MYTLAKAVAIVALGRALHAGGSCGDDCCTWAYCPCIKWWWLLVQGAVMGAAAALQLAGIRRRGRSLTLEGLITTDLTHTVDEHTVYSVTDS